MFDVDLVGQTLGSYIIVAKIGQGGMAIVYKAYETSLDRFVAIKVLPPSLAMESGFNARFEREAKAIARLNHPNILPIYGYGHQEGLSYLIMRFVQAGTLKDKLHQPLELTYIIDIIKQIGRALEYAHQSGVIHRDIKPSNILMADEQWPLLTDFGLAKMMESPSHLTGTGVGIGTPAYMSPEQAQGLKVDVRTDIYSLGIMLYEMVIGKVPYEAETPMAVALKHISAPLPIPSQVKPNLPKAIENVILKALAKQPEDRFQKVSDLLAAIDVVVSQNFNVLGGIPALGVEAMPAEVEEPFNEPTVVSTTPKFPSVVQPPSQEAAFVEAEELLNQPTMHEVPRYQPIAERSAKVALEPSPASIQSLNESVEEKGVSFPPKEVEEKHSRIIQRPRWIAAGITAVLLLLAFLIWSPWKMLPVAIKVQPKTATSSAQPVIPVGTEKTHPLPTATPVNPTFILQLTSSSDWSAVVFASSVRIRSSKRINTSGAPKESRRDGQRINLHQDIHLAFVGHQISATHEIILYNVETLESIELNVDAGCLGNTEVAIMNTQTEPPVVVFRHSILSCQPTPLSVPTELLKTSSPKEAAWIGPPPPTLPVKVDTDESKYVMVCSETQPPNQQLCVVNAHSGKFVQLTKDLNYRELGYSAWMADGQQIYYYAQSSNSTPWSTFIMNADGSNITKLIDTPEVTFSPDGQTIAYSDGCQVLRLMDSDGTGRRFLNTPGVRCMGLIRWSPDSTRLAFADLFDWDNRPPDIWVINQDGSGLQRLYTFDEIIWVHGLAWNPEGTQVGFWYENRADKIIKGFLLDANQPSDPQPIDWYMPPWWTSAFWPQWGIK